MGSSSSSVSPSDSQGESKKDNLNKANYEEISEIESKEADGEFENKCKKSVNEIETQLEQIENSIKFDNSIGNLTLQFSEMLGIEGVNISTIGNVVKKMITEWDYLSNNKDLEKYIGKDEMNGLKKLRFDYFVLLLKTANVISQLCESCQIQQENVQDLLDIVNKTQQIGHEKLNEIDIITYRESLTQLVEWIDQSKVNLLIKQWKNMCDRIEETKSRFEKIIETKFNGYKRLKLWQKCAIALGIIGAVGAVITLIILTSGAGTAIALPLAKTVTICGVKMLSSHLIGCSIGFGGATLLTVGGIAYGYCVVPSNSTLKKMEQITEMLKDLIKTSLTIKKQLSQLNDKTGKIKTRVDGLQDQQSVIKLKRALNKCKIHLNDYYQQGQDLIEIINQECQRVIDTA